MPRSIPRPPGGLTTQMRLEVEALVQNKIELHAKQTAEFVAEMLRQFNTQNVEFGLYTPDGIERLRAAQDARHAAEAADAATDSEPPIADPAQQSGITLLH